MKKSRRKEFKRINLFVEISLYNMIKQKAEEAYLPIATWARLCIQKSVHQGNNLIANNKTNGSK